MKVNSNEERERGIAAKAKDRTTLFELLSHDRTGVRRKMRPSVWRAARKEPPPPEPEPVRAEPEPVRPEPEPAPPEPEPEPQPVRSSAPDEPAREDPPIIELEDDRIRISLTSVGCAFVVFVFAVAVFAGYRLGYERGEGIGRAAGYELGRNSYAAEIDNEIELARRRPPATEAVASLLETAEPPPATQAEPPVDGGQSAAAEWIHDYTYIVAQEFAAGRIEDARMAQAFLAERGIETAMITTPRGTTQLITVQGFNRNDPAQRQLADQLLKKVHQAGADYYAAGGGYKMEGYFKTFKGESW